MEPYDILMVIVLVAATIFGAWKGMVWQLASLASLVVSYFVALQFSPQLAPMFGDQAPWNRFIAMLAVYIGCSLVIWLLFRVVAGFLDRVKLKEFDRQLGAIFGLAKGVLLCVAITFFAVSLLPGEKKETVLDSRSGHYIGVLLTKSHGLMPEEIHEVLHPYLNKLEEKLAPDGPVEHGPDEHNSGDRSPADRAHTEPETEMVRSSSDHIPDTPFPRNTSLPVSEEPLSPFDAPNASIPNPSDSNPFSEPPSDDQGADLFDWDTLRDSAIAGATSELWRLATEPSDSQP